MKKNICLVYFILATTLFAQDFDINVKYTSVHSEAYINSFTLEGAYEFNNNLAVGVTFGWANIILDEYIDHSKYNSTYNYKSPYALLGLVGYYYPFNSSDSTVYPFYIGLRASILYGELFYYGGSGMISQEGFHGIQSKNDYTATFVIGYKQELEVFNILLDLGVQYRTYNEVAEWYGEVDGSIEYVKIYKTPQKEISFIYQFGIQWFL